MVSVSVIGECVVYWYVLVGTCRVLIWGVYIVYRVDVYLGRVFIWGVGDCV